MIGLDTACTDAGWSVEDWTSLHCKIHSLDLAIDGSRCPSSKKEKEKKKTKQNSIMTSEISISYANYPPTALGLMKIHVVSSYMYPKALNHGAGSQAASHTAYPGLRTQESD